MAASPPNNPSAMLAEGAHCRQPQTEGVGIPASDDNNSQTSISDESRGGGSDGDGSATSSDNSSNSNSDGTVDGKKARTRKLMLGWDRILRRGAGQG